MSNTSIVKYVTELCEPLIVKQGMELIDVEYVKEGAYWYLRFFIDKEGGVDLDDCALISNAVSEILDKEDKITTAYMLEVSSPGLERPLKKDQDYEKFKGKLISVHTTRAHQGFKDFTGYLEGLMDQEVVLVYDGEQVRIPREIIDKAHLALDF